MYLLLFRSLHEIMIAPEENLSCRVYNVAGMSFTPDILLNAVRKHVPELEIKYNVDDRQKIADTWPEVFDDSQARQDWGWQHHIDLEQLVDIMIRNLKIIYQK